MNNNYGRGNTQRQVIDIDKTKRILSVLVAIAVWAFSMRFSVSGFGNGVNKDEVWMGWILAGIITIVELIWNSMKERTNLTIWVTGVFCYAYGIATNVIGIMYWQGNTIEKAMESPVVWIFPIILGVFLEILPEPMFMLGITGDHNQGDFLGNLFGNKMIPNPNHTKTTTQSIPSKPQQPKSNYQPSHKPNEKSNDRPQQKPIFQQPDTHKQDKREPPYQNPQSQQRKSENDSQSRMSIRDIQKAPVDSDWLKKQIKEQESWERPDLYNHGFDDLGMEHFPE